MSSNTVVIRNWNKKRVRRPSISIQTLERVQSFLNGVKANSSSVPETLVPITCSKCEEVNGPVCPSDIFRYCVPCCEELVQHYKAKDAKERSECCHWKKRKLAKQELLAHLDDPNFKFVMDFPSEKETFVIAGLKGDYEKALQVYNTRKERLENMCKEYKERHSFMNK